MRSLWLTAAISLMAALLFAADNNSGDPPSKHAEKQQKPTTAIADNKGEKLFETHCGRCHQVPEDISPSAAGAVVKHMRVRATLSQEDERLILEFIAPR